MIFVLFVTDFFDTIGTAVAVSSAGGLLDEYGQPPRLKRLLLVDSAAAAGGGAMGVSSVTTYVESGAGVAEGARTGLAALVTAVCFLLTIFFVPLIAVVAQTVIVGEAQLHPAIAPALIMIGYLMIRLVADIDWSRPEAGIPAFLVIAGVPLTFSISAGIGLGVLGYVAAMVAIGRAREVHPLMWALVPLFVAFFASDWLSAATCSSVALHRGRGADKTAPMDEFAVGATFADHVIRGVAGRGGMGVVYRALHVPLKREVALKVIAPEASADEAFRTRFRHEFEAAAAIQHPNVVPIHHAGEEDGLLFVTMRYVDGPTSRASWRRRRGWSRSAPRG